jgi:hypothetical protein
MLVTGRLTRSDDREVVLDQAFVLRIRYVWTFRGPKTKRTKVNQSTTAVG